MLRMHFDRQAVEQGLEPPNLPPLEDPLETPEQRQRREDKEQHEEAKKKADYAKRELEALQQIVELQRTNAVYPLGRDRQYRRYWLFSSLPAVLVEDHELFLTPAVVQATSVLSEEKADMPTLTRQEDHNTSSDKENELGRAVSTGSPKVNGAKDNECIVISDNEDADVKVKDKVVPTVMDEDKVVSQEREDKAVSIEAAAQVDNMDTEEIPPSVEMEPPKLDSLPLEQVLQQQQPKWYLLDSKECLHNIMASLNPRGFRESSLQAALQDFRPLLDVMIDSCPLEALNPLPEGEESKSPKPQVHTRTSAPRIVEGSTQSDSASEAIELTLRDGLLDLEDRIFVGSLGAIKVSIVHCVFAMLPPPPPLHTDTHTPCRDSRTMKGSLFQIWSRSDYNVAWFYLPP